MSSNSTTEQFLASLQPIVESRRDEIIGQAIDSNWPGSVSLGFAEFKAKYQIQEEMRQLASVALEGAQDA